MKKIFSVLGVILLFLLGWFLYSRSGKPSGAVTSVPGSQKFSDQSYYNSTYLISSDTLSTDAQKALTGFQMDKKSMPDGTLQITLKALEPSYHDQQYTLKPGEQLYFIEKFWADDQGGQEKNINDDTAVVVDSQGNVVAPPADFSK